SKSKRTEVYDYLDVMIRENTNSTSPNYIAFKNGIYNIEDDSFHPFSPEYVITNMIPWDWNPSAYFELTDQILNNISVHDETVRNLLEEMIGSCFYTLVLTPQIVRTQFRMALDITLFYRGSFVVILGMGLGTLKCCRTGVNVYDDLEMW
ncbi:MAG: hypothetical protein J6V04_02090, partial [Bacteroidales bacterium]|nr:hypothetical protein [Bacteroidales bacterium]